MCDGDNAARLTLLFTHFRQFFLHRGKLRFDVVQIAVG
jgi:hypothetical protein